MKFGVPGHLNNEIWILLYQSGAENPVKNLNILSKGIFTIKLQKMARIIMTMIFYAFQLLSMIFHD